MDAKIEKYEIAEKFAAQLKKDLYTSGMYQDKETLQFIFPLSDGTFLISSNPGRRQFLLKNKDQIKVFKILLTPTTNPNSKNVYIRMNDFSVGLINDKIDSMTMLKSALELRYNLKINKNDTSFVYLDEQIKNRISSIDNMNKLTDMYFLLFLYLGEYLRVNNQFFWRLKLKIRLPQFYMPKLFKPGRSHAVGFWPIIHRDLHLKNNRPISYLLKMVKNKK